MITSVANKHPDFEQVAVLRDDLEGATIKITRRDTGHHTFAIGKTFAKDGGTSFTSYLSRRHIAGVRKLLDELEDYLDRESDRAAPQTRAGRERAGVSTAASGK